MGPTKKKTKPPTHWEKNEFALIGDLEKTTTAVHSEVIRAIQMHGPYHSAHEAYAVILEELDEFWEQVRAKKQMRSKAKMREELLHVAATAIKAIVTLGLVDVVDDLSQL